MLALSSSFVDSGFFVSSFIDINLVCTFPCHAMLRELCCRWMPSCSWLTP